MSTRFFITAVLLGMCLAIPSGVAVADDKPDIAIIAVEREKPDGPPPPGWDDRDRPDHPRGHKGHEMRVKVMEPGMSHKGHKMKVKMMKVMGPPGMPGMDHKGHKMKVRVMEPGMGKSRGGMVVGRPDLTMMVRVDPMQRSDPEMYKLVAKDRELERGSMKLSERFRRAPKKARGEVKEQIEKIIAQHFEVRQQRRRLELERLEKELERLNTAIKRRHEARDDIIKRRVMQLTWEEDHLDF